MRGKLLFVAGGALGYVLGARAGRRRYEQIKAAAASVWQSPGVQKQVNTVEDYVSAKVGDVPGAVYDGVKKVVTQAAKRRQESKTQSPAPAAQAAVENASAGNG